MKKLPLYIERQLTVRSMSEKNLKATVNVLGARHGDLIMIDDPLCYINERLSVPIEGDIVCQLFHEGDMYRFQSRVRKSLGEGITVIDYPERFVAEAIRKHHRIQVNMEARFFLENTKETFRVTMLDISEGGCFIVVPQLIHVTENTLCRLEFSLPDKQAVSGLEGRVRTMHFLALKRTTGLGLQFTGPPEEVNKISAFCDYCMFFKV
jgi:c-di-GMP-binding flagellar brake protein YcgR